MIIVFSDHAKKQMIERKIPKKSILEAIKNPENKLSSYRNRELRQKQFNDKILEVVITEEENITIVVTQYYLEEETDENII